MQQAEREEKAKPIGITVTDKQIDTRLAQIKKQYFGGSDDEVHRRQLKQNELTDARARRTSRRS